MKKPKTRLLIQGKEKLVDKDVVWKEIFMEIDNEMLKVRVDKNLSQLLESEVTDERIQTREWVEG
jgi:hypothetical protein